MMEEGAEGNDERTYEPLNTANVRNHFDTSPEHSSSHSSPPKDTRNIVYLSLLTAGIGFVLPYNAFIIASDYWSERFPGRSVELDLSCTYIIVAFASVLLNNIFLSIAPFRIRIMFGESSIHFLQVEWEFKENFLSSSFSLFFSFLNLMHSLM